MKYEFQVELREFKNGVSQKGGENRKSFAEMEILKVGSKDDFQFSLRVS